jgi:diguanylate cyclase (GGDEF)-like protein
MCRLCWRLTGVIFLLATLILAPFYFSAQAPSLALFASLILLLTVVIMLSLQRVLLEPVLVLRKRVHRAIVDPKPISDRVRTGHWPHELGDLATDLDQLLEAVSGHLKSLARFPDENSQPVLRVDAEGRLLYANKASAPLLGFWHIAIGDVLPQSWPDVIRRVRAEHKTQSVDLKLPSSWLNLTLVPLAEAEVVNLYAIDITERKAYEETLRHQRNYDQLTELPNLALFQDRLQQSLVEADKDQQRVAVMILGLRDFSTINGLAGHEAGDQVLCEVGKRLQARLSPSMTLARIGGDLFGILVPDCTSVSKVAEFADALLATLAPPFLVGDQVLHCGARIGIALYPEDGADHSVLLSHADLALNSAGRGTDQCVHFFVAGLNQKVQQRTQRIRQLDEAITDGQLEVWYQPQISATSGEIEGAEALVRWRHPREGLISPAEFIPLAEETGLVLPLGETVLEQACQQVADWRSAGRGQLRMAVNLSARQLSDPQLLDKVIAVLERHRLPAVALELEITESAVMADTARAIAVMRQFVDLGVHLALDDFGTGYSSLSYLKQLPLQKIKIDRAFVRALPDDAQDLALCRAVVQIGSSMGMRVLAEGCETQAHVDCLVDLGVDALQGYYYGKPVPAKDFPVDLSLARFRQPPIQSSTDR